MEEKQIVLGLNVILAYASKLITVASCCTLKRVLKELDSLFKKVNF